MLHRLRLCLAPLSPGFLTQVLCKEHVSSAADSCLRPGCEHSFLASELYLGLSKATPCSDSSILAPSPFLRILHQFSDRTPIANCDPFIDFRSIVYYSVFLLPYTLPISLCIGSFLPLYDGALQNNYFFSLLRSTAGDCVCCQALAQIFSKSLSGCNVWKA